MKARVLLADNAAIEDDDDGASEELEETREEDRGREDCIARKTSVDFSISRIVEIANSISFSFVKLIERGRRLHEKIERGGNRQRGNILMKVG